MELVALRFRTASVKRGELNLKGMKEIIFYYIDLFYGGNERESPLSLLNNSVKWDSMHEGKNYKELLGGLRHHNSQLCVPKKVIKERRESVGVLKVFLGTLSPHINSATYRKPFITSPPPTHKPSNSPHTYTNTTHTH